MATLIVCSQNLPICSLGNYHTCIFKNTNSEISRIFLRWIYCSTVQRFVTNTSSPSSKLTLYCSTLCKVGSNPLLMLIRVCYIKYSPPRNTSYRWNKTWLWINFLWYCKTITFYTAFILAQMEAKFCKGTCKLYSLIVNKNVKKSFE